MVLFLVADHCIDRNFSFVVIAGSLPQPTFIPKKSLSAAEMNVDTSSSVLPWVVRHGCSTQADPLKSETKKRSASAGKNGMAVVRSHVVADHKASRSSSGEGARTGGSKRAPTSASKKQKRWDDDNEDDDDDEDASSDDDIFDAADGDDDDAFDGEGSRRVSIRAQTKPRKNYAVDGDDDEDEEEEDEDDEDDDEVNIFIMFFCTFYFLDLLLSQCESRRMMSLL